MGKMHTISIHTEQNYTQIFHFSQKKHILELKELLEKTGTKHIGNYSLRVEEKTLTYYKSHKFDGPGYVMDRNEAIQIVTNYITEFNIH